MSADLGYTALSGCPEPLSGSQEDAQEACYLTQFLVPFLQTSITDVSGCSKNFWGMHKTMLEMHVLHHAV